MRSITCLFSLLLLIGCAYPRHTTPLHVVASPKLGDQDQPPAMYTFRVLSAVVPQTKVSGLAWDDDGSAPDPFVRLYVDERLVWTSKVADNELQPEWNTVLPHNLVIASDSRFRLELWDYDTVVSAEPLGHIERRGLPENVLLDATARLQLDNKSMVAVMINAPRPHRGVGLSVEVREDALRVIAVKPYSPAARAGIQVGDRIVGIGNERVSLMRDDDAVSQLSLAAERKHTLVVADAKSRAERTVSLDQGYTWLAM